MRPRFALASIVLVVASIATTFTASATVRARPRSHARSGAGHARIGGVIGLHGRPVRERIPRRRPNLRYHGGPVMPASTTHVIYWTPPGHELDAPTYTDVIDRYLADAAVDSGLTTNVYSVLTQYTDDRGNRANYKQTSTASFFDVQPFPASGCPHYRSATGTLIKICLTNKQIRLEIHRVMVANGWSPGIDQAYFMVTPDGVGSCFNAKGRDCAFTTYCAYHSYAGSASTPTIFGNIPFAPMLRRGCGTPQSPNGPVDGTIDSISHEHREMTNDPLLNAWFDAYGNEGSDKCVGNYGKTLGFAPNGQAYNQVIGGNFYFTQREWSNRDRTCKARRA